MQLAQSARSERDDSRSDGSRDGEIARVDDGDVPPASRDGDARLGGRVVVDVRAGPAEAAAGSGVVRGRHGAVEDVGVGGGDGVEDGLVDAEVLGEDGFGGVGYPVVDHEGCADGVEVAWVV